MRKITNQLYFNNAAHIHIATNVQPVCFDFDLLFHLFIIICRIYVFKHTGCTLVAIYMCAALSKYN
jgi:hypothetical protein